MRSSSAASSRLVRRMPERTSWRTAASQPERLKTKQMAGSSPARWSATTTAERLGVGDPRRECRATYSPLAPPPNRPEP